MNWEESGRVASSQVNSVVRGAKWEDDLADSASRGGISPVDSALMGKAIWRGFGAALASMMSATLVVGLSATAQAQTALDTSGAVSTTGAVAAVQPSLKLAVTFDDMTAPLWTHSDQATMPVSTTVVTTGAGDVVRKWWAQSTIPADVAAVPGVKAGNTAHGTFPAYSADAAAQDFAGVALTPVAPGPSDILAPGLRSFTFGGDFRLDSPMPADNRKYDDGNNIVQRGLTGDDQYKLQVDVTPTGERLSCVLQDGATKSYFIVLSYINLTAGVWYRTRCTRTVVNGYDKVVMTLTNLQTGVLAETRTKTSTTPAANLDYPLASAATPTPIAIGVKLYPTGVLAKSMSDQFNGRLDNIYLSIG